MIINNKIYVLLIIMILVKNKLKKIKNTIDDEDMLNYLKYSHLEPIREDDVLKINTSNKATQAPDIMNNFSQTDKKKIWWIKRPIHMMNSIKLNQLIFQQ